MRLLATSFFLAIAVLVSSGQSSSTNYVCLVNVFDAGGLQSASAQYANKGNLDSIASFATTPLQVVNRTGYIGQLYEVTGFTLSAPATNINEGASMPLFAVQTLDDSTVTPVNGFAQWTFTPPLTGVNAAGLVTAGHVSLNTPASVQASVDGQAASLNLMVLNMDVPPGYNQITYQYLGAGGMRLSFVGISNAPYALERTFSLSPPVLWQPQITNATDPSGLVIFTNLANTSTNNFWRIRSVP